LANDVRFQIRPQPVGSKGDVEESVPEGILVMIMDPSAAFGRFP